MVRMGVVGGDGGGSASPFVDLFDFLIPCLFVCSEFVSYGSFVLYSSLLLVGSLTTEEESNGAYYFGIFIEV